MNILWLHLSDKCTSHRNHIMFLQTIPCSMNMYIVTQLHDLNCAMDRAGFNVHKIAFQGLF